MTDNLSSKFGVTNRVSQYEPVELNAGQLAVQFCSRADGLANQPTMQQKIGFDPVVK